MIDLRSDTVTRPGPGMRRAMAEAEVGDDVFGEDPTVRRLQERIAGILGKEAALFVPSGHMGNQIALRVLCRPGDEVIMEAGAHIANYEAGAGAALSGVQLRGIPSPGGLLEPDAVSTAVRAGYYWEPRTRLLAVENTANKAGGRVYPIERINGLAEAAAKHSLSMHLDGARLWNASVATGIAESEFAAPFDSVTVCLSKGLGAPIGSVLAGSEAFIKEAHIARKMYGGGMRQVGILAAAGLYAIEHHRELLAADHARARRIAEALADMEGLDLDLGTVETNIIMFDVRGGLDALDVVDRLKRDQLLVSPFGPKTIRITTHLDISDDDVDRALQILAGVLEG
ncbi:MAG: low specificity L-threonine aldolase [Rhodothermales bacterium]|nr:low specificity L-threonine aldolase [Rhodothermales bacterium]